MSNRYKWRKEARAVVWELCYDIGVPVPDIEFGSGVDLDAYAPCCRAYYSRRPGVITLLRGENDMSVVCHELAHHIQFCRTGTSSHNDHHTKLTRALVETVQTAIDGQPHRRWLNKARKLSFQGKL